MDNLRDDAVMQDLGWKETFLPSAKGQRRVWSLPQRLLWPVHGDAAGRELGG